MFVASIGDSINVFFAHKHWPPSATAPMKISADLCAINIAAFYCARGLAKRNQSMIGP